MIYPIGIQNFESLVNDGYVYVDKTKHIHRLATTGRYYFLSRPRRFGKSLLVSTMDSYFSGRKDLFNGLALEQLEQQLLSGNVDCASLHNEIDMMQNNPIPMILQSGYLTIKDYDKEAMSYSLGFPNREVTRAFNMLLKYL